MLFITITDNYQQRNLGRFKIPEPDLRIFLPPLTLCDPAQTSVTM